MCGMGDIQLINDLWYIGSQLIILQSGDIQENLFRLAHNSLGHFGMEKLYITLRDCYWPNMRKDLETSYILGCLDCQCDKSRTSKSPRPLHLLLVPDS